jgi:hypothetical protein
MGCAEQLLRVGPLALNHGKKALQYLNNFSDGLSVVNGPRLVWFRTKILACLNFTDGPSVKI